MQIFLIEIWTEQQNFTTRQDDPAWTLPLLLALLITLGGGAINIKERSYHQIVTLLVRGIGSENQNLHTTVNGCIYSVCPNDLAYVIFCWAYPPVSFRHPCFTILTGWRKNLKRTLVGLYYYSVSSPGFAKKDKISSCNLLLVT